MANCDTKRMKKGGKVAKPKKMDKVAKPKKMNKAPKSKGTKVRGTGAATKGLYARGPMA